MLGRRHLLGLGASALLAVSLGLGVAGCAQSTGDAGSAQAGSAATQTASTRVYTDDGGREVEIPTAENIDSIYFTGASAQIYLYTLAPELACGTTMEFTDAELEYLPEGTGDLPYLGTVSGGGELNPEAIVDAGPDIIFDVTMGGITDSDVSNDDDLQEQTGIPVLLFDGDINGIPELYEKLGDVLGREERAKELGDYCKQALSAVEDAVSDIPEDEKVSVYYAEGSEGLQTEPSSSVHALFLEMSGAHNVADVEAQSGKGQSDVSMEQVLAWDPEVIIAWDDVVRGGADELIRTDPNWANITAVKNGRVYTMCNTPFSWCDRPPAVNRVLGIQWVANMLYPDRYDVDMMDVTKEFYKLFYEVDLTDEQAQELLGNSYPVYQAE